MPLRKYSQPLPLEELRRRLVLSIQFAMLLATLWALHVLSSPVVEPPRANQIQMSEPANNTEEPVDDADSPTPLEATQELENSAVYSYTSD